MKDIEHTDAGGARHCICDDIRRVAELASEASGVSRATIEAVLADEVERRGAGGLLALVALLVVHADMAKIAAELHGVADAIDCR